MKCEHNIVTTKDNIRACNKCYELESSIERNCEHLYKDASDPRYCVDCGVELCDEFHDLLDIGCEMEHLKTNKH